MTNLTLETFLTAGSDPEAGQYRIMSSLKGYRSVISQNKLYPYLTDLIEIASTLEGLLNERSALSQKLPQELTGIDLEQKRLVYTPVSSTSRDLEGVLQLISWALPLIRQTIDEGTGVYEFVADHLSIEEVGLVPFYREEGYYFIPDHRAGTLHLMRYGVALYSSGNEKFRTLKTRVVRSIPESSLLPPPESLKLELIEEHQDLPNPATFVCSTDLDFPFKETMFPVAKRKLMAQLAA